MRTFVSINQVLLIVSIIIQGAFISVLFSEEYIISSEITIIFSSIILATLILVFFTQINHLQYINSSKRIEELEKHAEENWDRYIKATQKLNKAVSLIEDYNNKDISLNEPTKAKLVENSVETVNSEM